jgi:hypothetical protein
MGLFLEFLAHNIVAVLIFLNECIYEPLQPPSLCCSSCLAQQLDFVKCASCYSVCFYRFHIDYVLA